MGNSSSKVPKTEKITTDDQNNFLRYGVCEMQGWRKHMVLFKIILGRCVNFYFKSREMFLPIWSFRLSWR